jgi:probable HAF family extracellular repeat protein
MARRTVPYLLRAAAIASLLAWPAPRARAAAYSIADIGVLKGHTTSLAYAINAGGVVVGESADDQGVNHAVILRNGKLHDLGFGKNQTYAWVIDADGDVLDAARKLGKTRDKDGLFRAVIWMNDKPTELATLGGDWSQALAINRQRVIVGDSSVKPGKTAVVYACRWDGGKPTNLGTLGGFSVANDVNNRGWIVGGSNTVAGAGTLSAGAHAVLWKNGNLIDLGTLPGGEIAQARAIDERGRIVGYSTTGPGEKYSGSGMHAFLWENGAMTDLGTFPGADISLAFAMNERAQAVGYALLPGTPADPRFGYAATLWNDRQILNLNDAIPADSGWFLATAYGINDAGQIVGLGYHDGVQRGFVMTPV